MENKKDIGKAFRDKLDGLQKQPGSAVWDAIRSDLPKKKSHRFLPLFWIEASTAIKTVVVTLTVALISVISFLSIPDNSSKNTQTEQVNKNNTDTDSAISIHTKNNTSPDKKTKRNASGTIAGNNGEESTKNSDSANATNKLSANTARGNTEKKSGAIIVNDGSTKESSNRNTFGTNAAAITPNTPSARTNNKTVRNSVKSGNRSNGKSSIATNTMQTGKAKNAALGNNNKQGGDNLSVTSSAKATDDITNLADYKSQSDETIANETTSTDTISSEIEVALIDSLTIAEDSAAICKDTVEENTLKADANSNPDFKRFYVFAHAAPTSYSIKDALLPDTLLAGNKTTLKTSFNYGAYIGYNYNSKWGVRTGVGITKLEHTTQNALLQSTYSVVPGTNYVHLMPPADYTNINYTRNGSNAAALVYLGGQLPEATVNIIQKIEFAEIPVEVTYNLYSNKFGVGIQGGFTALFTTRNIVFAQNNMGNLWLGSNKNVKDVSFSATLGLHFYYKPLPYLQLNAEPVFKYYLNTFQNTSPYSFGLQVGLQYNFNLFSTKK